MDLSQLHTSGSVVIAAAANDLYDFIADMPAIGAISDQCNGGVWESDARGVGALFIGSNAWGEMKWTARQRVVVADPGREFAWVNLGEPTDPKPDDATPLIRWGYTFEAVDGGTRVEESWRILHSYAQLEGAPAEQLDGLPRMMHRAIEKTLAKLKAKFEA